MVVALGQYDWSLAARRMLILDFFQQAIRGQGTDKHQWYIEAASNLEVNPLLFKGFKSGEITNEMCVQNTYLF